MHSINKVISGILVSLLLTACGGTDSGSSNSDLISVDNDKTYKWKLVTSWPKNYPGLGTGPENFAKLVDRMSSGRLQVRVYGAGEIVPALEVFSAVSSHTAEMGHSGAYYWKGKIPSAVFFATVPFGMNAQEMNGWLHHGGGLELWREIYEPFNLVPFAGGNTGVQMAGWFNKQVNSVDDFKGLKMRIPGTGGDVFSRAGGTAVGIPGGEIYTSLQTGVIDAAEWVSPYNDLAFGFSDVAKYYYYPGWHEPGATLEFIVNKQAYESLPDDLQAIVEVATRAVNQDMLDEYTARNNAALVELRNKGADIRPLPKNVLDRLRELSVEVLEESAAGDADFSRVYNSYKEFASGVSAYHSMTEKAMYDTRQ